MGESSRPKGRTKVIWILLLVALVLVWYYNRPAEDNGMSKSEFAQAQSEASAYADPDDILVDFDDDLSAKELAAIEAELGIDLVLVSDQSYDERFYRAHVTPERQSELLAALSKMDSVQIAEPDADYAAFCGVKIRERSNLGAHSQPRLPFNNIKSAPTQRGSDIDWAGFPNDPQYQHQWHMDQINMPEAWKLSDGGGVVVAVLDTGVAYENYGNGAFHLVEDLEGVAIYKPWDFVGNTEHANDDHGHGTHVAGTIAQATHNGKGVAGVARNVKIMPLKVLSAGGSGSVAGIADAIRYAADEGAQVINMSLGGPFPSRVLKKAVQYAHDKGVTVIAAAGNDGRKKLGYPAAYPGAVAVGATQYDKSTTFYSNYGKHLDIAAPGGNTRVDQNGDGMPDGVLQNTIVVGDATQSGYFGFMGTSMAAPHAAGVAALIVGEGVTDPKAVEAILKETASQPKGYTEEKYGAGLIDAEAAVLKARAGAGGWQLLLAALLAGGLVFGTRRRISLNAGFAGGIVLGASGLFFLPYISGTLASLPILETLTRGLPTWDLAFVGAQGHGNVLFFSALIPLGLLSLLWGIKRIRPLLLGLSLGMAGHFLFHAIAPLTDIQYMAGDSLWLLANAGLLITATKLGLKRPFDEAA